MAPHSSTLAWKIPWTEESSRLQSMGSLRVVSLSLFPFMYWRRKWQPTPVFLPGESQGRGSLVGCRLWGRTESDTTEVTQQQQQQFLSPQTQQWKTYSPSYYYKLTPQMMGRHFLKGNASSTFQTQICFMVCKTSQQMRELGVKLKST